MIGLNSHRIHPSLAELLTALDVEIKHLQQLRHELARGCDHEEIEQHDAHYYCLICGAYVGDIDGLWKGDPVNHKPYIKEDDPRIKAVRLPQPRRVPECVGH